MLFQLPRHAAGAPGQDYQRSLHTLGSRYGAVRAGPHGARPAALHHQFGAAQPDRCAPVARGGYTVDTSNVYNAQKRAFGKLVTDEDRANADVPFAPDRDAAHVVATCFPV